MTLFPGASTESETVRLLRNFKQDHQLKTTPTSEVINQFYPNIRPDNKHDGYCIRLHGQKIRPLTLPRTKTDASKISPQTEAVELHGLKDILNQHPDASLKKFD